MNFSSLNSNLPEFGKYLSLYTTPASCVEAMAYVPERGCLSRLFCAKPEPELIKFMEQSTHFFAATYNPLVQPLLEEGFSYLNRVTVSSKILAKPTTQKIDCLQTLYKTAKEVAAKTKIDREHYPEKLFDASAYEILQRLEKLFQKNDMKNYLPTGGEAADSIKYIFNKKTVAECREEFVKFSALLQKNDMLAKTSSLSVQKHLSKLGSLLTNYYDAALVYDFFKDKGDSLNILPCLGELYSDNPNMDHPTRREAAYWIGYIFDFNRRQFFRYNKQLTQEYSQFLNNLQLFRATSKDTLSDLSQERFSRYQSLLENYYAVAQTYISGHQKRCSRCHTQQPTRPLPIDSPPNKNSVMVQTPSAPPAEQILTEEQEPGSELYPSLLNQEKDQPVLQNLPTSATAPALADLSSDNEELEPGSTQYHSAYMII